MMMANLPDPSSYQAIGWLVLGLAGLATALNQGSRLIDRWKDKPSPGDVRHEAADKFVTKPEFRDHVLRNDQEHDNFFKKLGGVERGLTRELQEMERRINAKDEERTTKVHDRLNDLLAAVAAINERTERQKQTK